MFFIYFLLVILSKNILVKCIRNCYFFSKIYIKKKWMNFKYDRITYIILNVFKKNFF